MTGIASGSHVTMIDGNDKPIEKVEIGDDVLAYDFDNKRVMFGKVTAVRKNSGMAFGIVTANTTIIASGDHMFFVSENADMKQAADLQVGGEILWFDLFHGRKDTIVEKRSVSDSVFYDFVVADYGNFIANGVIVAGK